MGSVEPAGRRVSACRNWTTSGDDIKMNKVLPLINQAMGLAGERLTAA